MNPELSPSPRDTPPSPSLGPSLPDSHALEGKLPPPPVEEGQRLACFDNAWELLESPTFANTILDRHKILRAGLVPDPPKIGELEQATLLIEGLGPFRCRDRLSEFFRWQATATPEAPLHRTSRIIDDRALEEESSLSRIPSIAKSLVTSGFVDATMAGEALSYLHEDIITKNPISKGSSLLSIGLAGAAYHLLPLPLALASMVAAAFVVRSYRTASWARHEYTIGYLQEVFDTHQALSRGEAPTIIGALQTHYTWEGNERFRADGYMIARTLRLLEVPSASIHEAYATTASVELPNQPLTNLLMEKLKAVNLNVSGCLAAEYFESHKTGSSLAKVLDALNECYFIWGRRFGLLYQNKMIELLQPDARQKAL